MQFRRVGVPGQEKADMQWRHVGGELAGQFPHSSREWLRFAAQELDRAVLAFDEQNPHAGVVGAKRAAGMALRGAALDWPHAGWGRSYVQHLAALERDADCTERVRRAARQLLDARSRCGGTPTATGAVEDERVIEAARDVVAYAGSLIHSAASPKPDGLPHSRGPGTERGS